MKAAIPTLLLLAALLTGAPARCGETLQILGDPRPGTVLFVTLEGVPEGTRATLVFTGGVDTPATPSGAIYRFSKGRSGLSVPISVSANEKPGEKEMAITVTLAGGEERKLTRRIIVKKRSFRRSYITMAKSTAAKYTDPKAEEEDAKCRKAREELIGEQLWSKPFIVPCAGSYGTRFGLRRYVNGKDNGYHGGLDINAPYGREVRAANDGVVGLADDTFILRGKTVIVNHGQGLTTHYLHLSRLAVKPGQKVTRGQIIAYVGSTGASTGPHLHWTAFCGSAPFDPLLLLTPPKSWLGR